ncbi:MAG: hypothetical protein JWN48_91 [Myxococcaceae bacterium]|nr:hypothetical protein [Myxococcaceae bacterium]
MKKLLILAALAGFGAGACGDDSGDKPSTPSTTSDAGSKDAAVARPQQIETGKVGLACTTNTAKADCGNGPGTTCVTTQGQGDMSLTFPGGYCSATCEATSECGAGAACPVADIIAKLPAAFAGVVTPATLTGLGLPSNCLQKCAAATECRSGYSCASLASAAGSQVPATVSGFLGTDTFCLPPITARDGGVARVDAGATTTLGGMDGGV